MVTMAQRIEALRTEAGLSRPALAAALGLPKSAFEKFETGRQTPSKDQQEKIAAYFGVSIFYLRGESGDRTRQDDWMTASGPGPGEERPSAPPPSPARPAQTDTQQGTLLDALLAGRQAKEALRSAVLEALRSPEGQELLSKAIQKELARKK